MSAHPKPHDPKPWFEPPHASGEVESGYEDWLAAEIEAGCAELDAGKGIPAAEVWKELGLE